MYRYSINTYIYICVCVCAMYIICVCVYIYIYISIHIYIYIYIYERGSFNSFVFCLRDYGGQKNPYTHMIKQVRDKTNEKHRKIQKHMTST